MIKYGFQYLETPSFEYSDSIGKFLPDKDRPDEGVFSFQDENKWISLRYDLTRSTSLLAFKLDMVVNLFSTNVSEDMKIK